MSESFDDTRAQLRSYLVPAPGDPPGLNGADDFPRSAVMRFAFNPRNRRLLVVTGSVLAVLAARAFGTSRMSLITDIARSFTRNRT